MIPGSQSRERCETSTGEFEGVHVPLALEYAEDEHLAAPAAVLVQYNTSTRTVRILGLVQYPSTCILDCIIPHHWIL
jgi:hypothetical protein